MKHTYPVQGFSELGVSQQVLKQIQPSHPSKLLDITGFFPQNHPYHQGPFPVIMYFGCSQFLVGLLLQLSWLPLLMLYLVAPPQLSLMLTEKFCNRYKLTVISATVSTFPFVSFTPYGHLCPNQESLIFNLLEIT